MHLIPLLLNALSSSFSKGFTEIQTLREASTSCHRLLLPTAGCYDLPRPQYFLGGWVARQDGRLILRVVVCPAYYLTFQYTSNSTHYLRFIQIERLLHCPMRRL